MSVFITDVPICNGVTKGACQANKYLLEMSTAD